MQAAHTSILDADCQVRVLITRAPTTTRLIRSHRQALNGLAIIQVQVRLVIQTKVGSLGPGSGSAIVTILLENTWMAPRGHHLGTRGRVV